MNLAYFHLRARPFRPTPDTQSYYPAASHETALHRLNQAIAADEGIVVLTGAPGTGKTLVGHLLLQRAGDIAAAFITNCRFGNRSELLKAVLFDLSQPYQGLGEQELRFALTEYLLGNFQRDQKTIVLFDEAHDLTPDLLEELRLLSNLESQRGKAVQIVAIGQPLLLEKLRLPELASLQQRIAVRWQLEMLCREEAIEYMQHQIQVAGGEPAQIFGDEALQIIAERTAGVPRLINQAASACLALAESVEAESVDTEVVLDALSSLGLPSTDAGEEEETVDELRTATETNSTVPEYIAPKSGRGPLYFPGMHLNNLDSSSRSPRLHDVGSGPSSFTD
jgi:type II secretory pathway predicted ATPase ExeA